MTLAPRFPLGLGLLAVACTLACNLDAQRRNRRQAPEPEAGSWQPVRFESKSLDREATFRVFVPNGYEAEENKDKRYPMVLWLHGMNEDETRFVNRGGGETLDGLMDAGDIPEMLFVCPSDGTRRSFYVNRGEGGNFEDLITKDILEHMEANFRVGEGRGQRAIMGISMGGMGALRIALKNPELFGTVATHSAAVMPLDPDDLPERFKAFSSRIGLDDVFGSPIDKSIWARENPLNLAVDATPKTLKGLRIRFDAGSQDRYGFQTGNSALHDALEEAKIPHTWDLVDGGGHAWGSGFQMESLAASLRFVSEGFATASSKDAGLKGLSDAIPGAKKQDGK